ncbi:MAG: hypothetical protein ACJZ57_05365 [Candidatus Poriferisodalaceae bacterium]
MAHVLDFWTEAANCWEAHMTFRRATGGANSSLRRTELTAAGYGTAALDSLFAMK